MLIQIKNAQAVGLERVLIPFSNMSLAVVGVLKDKGFLGDFEKKKKKSKKGELNFIEVKLRYDNGESAIKGLKLISKPSRRIYAGKKDLKQVMSGYGMSVLTTPKGILAGDDAKKQNVGGELLFEIW